MRHVPLQPPLIWQDYLFFAVLGALALPYPLAAGLAALLLLGADKRLWTRPRLFFAIFVFCGSFAYTAARFEISGDIQANTPAWAFNWDRDTGPAVCGTVVSSQGMPGKRLRVILTDVQPEGGGSPLPGQCAWTWTRPGPQRPLPGQEVCLNRPIRLLRGLVNTDEPDVNYSFGAQNIFWRVSSYGGKGDVEIFGSPGFSAMLREKIRLLFLKALDCPKKHGEYLVPQGKAILLALVFGDKYYLAKNTVDNFAKATLAHSLALSGQHLCVAGLMGMFIILGLAKVRPQIFLSSPRLVLVSMASLPLAFAYLWLGNAPASLLRAVCMLAIFAVWLWRGKAFSSTDILCAALFLILIYNPLAIFDIGLQLSVLCLGVLTITSAAFNKYIPREKPKDFFFKRYLFRLGQILAVSLLIQLALLPLALSRFYVAGCWFMLNIVWLPLLGILVLPLAFLGLILVISPIALLQPLASFILYLASLPCNFMVQFLKLLEKMELLREPAFLLPHWSCLLVFSLLLILLSWLLSRPLSPQIQKTGKKVMLAALLFMATGPLLRIHNFFDDSLRLDVLDVGQGQAVLIQFPHQGRLLIDGGGIPGFDPGKYVLAPFLSYNRPPQIDAVFNSHPDYDHLGGLLYLLDKFPVKKLFHNGLEADDHIQPHWQKQINSHESIIPADGDEIILGDKNSIRLEVMHPPRHSKLWVGNDGSLIIRLSRNDKGLALIPGDAGYWPLLRIMDYERSAAKVLVAPHHGSDNNFVPEFYAKRKPEIALVSTGYYNQWHFPGIRLTNWLFENKIPFLNTAITGRISVEFKDDNTLEVTICRQPNQTAEFADLEN